MLAASLISNTTGINAHLLIRIHFIIAVLQSASAQN